MAKFEFLETPRRTKHRIILPSDPLLIAMLVSQFNPNTDTLTTRYANISLIHHHTLPGTRIGEVLLNQPNMTQLADEAEIIDWLSHQHLPQLPLLRFSPINLIWVKNLCNFPTVFKSS